MTSKKSLHDIIVDDILPRVSRRLKREGLILGYDRKQFTMLSFHEEGKPMRITPDLVLYHPNGDKILVEVANPRDPKRFLGEMVYPAILKHNDQIRASLVFVIGDIGKHGRSLTERNILSKMLGSYSSRLVSYPHNEDSVYRSLENLLEIL